jgi:hypothetical protein
MQQKRWIVKKQGPQEATAARRGGTTARGVRKRPTNEGCEERAGQELSTS